MNSHCCSVSKDRDNNDEFAFMGEYNLIMLFFPRGSRIYVIFHIFGFADFKFYLKEIVTKINLHKPVCNFYRFEKHFFWLLYQY